MQPLPAGSAVTQGTPRLNEHALTHDLDDLGQEDAIGHILLEILDEPFVAGFGQIMIGPVRVDLQKSKQAT